MSEQKAKPIQYWGLRAAAFYQRAEGETIILHLTTGEDLIGELLGVDQYDITLDPGDDTTLLVPKHSIVYVVLGSADSGES